MTRDPHATHPPSDRTLGLLLVLASVLAFSSAGILVKGLAAAPWDIIFWRGVFAAGFTLVWIAARGRLRADLPAMGWSGLAAACVEALGTAAFISAFKLTSVAHVALIYALAPLLAALIAWAWIAERPSGRLLAVLFLAEVPSQASLIGGGLILAAVLASSLDPTQRAS